jgi:hypothetical protein
MPAQLFIQVLSQEKVPAGTYIMESRSLFGGITFDQISKDSGNITKNNGKSWPQY